jgi:hypothetical protein
MNPQERQLLNNTAGSRQAPAIAVAVVMIVVIAILLSVAPWDDSFCALIGVMGVFIVIAIVTGVTSVRPLQTAMSQGIVYDLTAPCVPLSSYTKAVGPIHFNPDWGTAESFPDNRTLTVGFVQGANMIVSVNGTALEKLLNATPTHDIAYLASQQPAPQQQMITHMEQRRTARGDIVTTQKTSAGGASQPLVITTQPSSVPQTINVTIVNPTPEKPPEPKPVEVPSKKCPKCGEPVKDHWKACPSCNATLIEEPPPPKPAELIEPEPPVELPKFCPFHGYRTTIKEDKAWCPRCNYFLDAPPEFCPYHGCRTEMRDGEAYCPRCEAVVKPL